MDFLDCENDNDSGVPDSIRKRLAQTPHVWIRLLSRSCRFVRMKKPREVSLRSWNHMVPHESQHIRGSLRTLTRLSTRIWEPPHSLHLREWRALLDSHEDLYL